MNINKTFNDLLPNESKYYRLLFLNKHWNIIKKHFGWFKSYKLGDTFMNLFTLNLTEIDVEESKMIKSPLKYSIYDLDIPIIIDIPINILMSMNYMYNGLFRESASSKYLDQLESEILKLAELKVKKDQNFNFKFSQNYSELDFVEVYKRLMRSFNTAIISSQLIDYFIKIEKINDNMEKLICCQAIYYIIKKKNRHLIEHAIKLCMKIYYDVKNNQDYKKIKKHLDINGFCMTMLPSFFITLNSSWILTKPEVFINVLEFFFRNFIEIITLDQTLLNTF